MTKTLPSRGHLAVVLMALVAPLTACADSESAASGDAPSSPASSTAAPEPSEAAESSSAAADESITARMNGWRVTVTLEATDRFRNDPVFASRIHLLPLDVVSDATAERWGDVFVWSPTRVYDPATQERRKLPADPVTWLRDNPGVEVLREKRVDLGDAGGHRAWQFDVDRDGSELFGDRDGGMEGDGFERLVLWKVQDTWFLAQAGTFRGKRGLLAPEQPDDVFGQVLASAEYHRA